MTQDKKEIPQTPEAVAYQLMREILDWEDKPLGTDRIVGSDQPLPKREEILETYKQCIAVVKGW